MKIKLIENNMGKYKIFHIKFLNHLIFFLYKYINILVY